jgi:glycosyltransferase involved in cell wall biosynthesis
MHQAQSPLLTVVVNFFNMRREAKRTLYSLTTEYQSGVAVDDFEVVAVDNGSGEPLDDSWVRGLAPNFKHIYYETDCPSPCAAINYAITSSNSPLVMCVIDGARILSPGILRYSFLASRLYEHPFIYTLGMHLGKKPQNYSMLEGYDQHVEDELIDSIGWQTNGYELFKISSVALSSKNGFFSKLSESNCFTLRRDDFLGVGGYDQRFQAVGGGLANLDFFNRVHESEKTTPVMLLGEATFHQFHGGVATNVPLAEHPWEKMVREYELIKGSPFSSSYKSPIYYGHVPVECQSLLKI